MLDLIVDDYTKTMKNRILKAAYYYFFVLILDFS